MHTDSGLSLNKVTKPAPVDVSSLQGILLRSKCHVFDIKKFFCSAIISDKDSYLRTVCVPLLSFSTKPSPDPSWIFYRDRAILFRDSALGDYRACAKAATVFAHLPDSLPELQDTIRQALIDYTFVDNGGVGANSKKLKK